MEFDIFFSICQTEVDGYLPDERTMFANFFEQVELADRLGFGTAISVTAAVSLKSDIETAGADAGNDALPVAQSCPRLSPKLAVGEPRGRL